MPEHIHFAIEFPRRMYWWRHYITWRQRVTFLFFNKIRCLEHPLTLVDIHALYVFWHISLPNRSWRRNLYGIIKRCHQKLIALPTGRVRPVGVHSIRYNVTTWCRFPLLSVCLWTVSLCCKGTCTWKRLGILLYRMRRFPLMLLC